MLEQRPGIRLGMSFRQAMRTTMQTFSSLAEYLLANENKETAKTTTPVDQFPPNALGIYDMHGNIYEWCQDSWHDSYAGAPIDGRAWVDKMEPVEHVARGGAAYTVGTACRSATRRQQRANCGARPYNPEEEGNDSKSLIRDMFDFREYYGLRVVCSPRLLIWRISLANLSCRKQTRR